MAEREGFEPSERYKRSLPFQGSAIDHSAISPKRKHYITKLIDGSNWYDCYSSPSFEEALNRFNFITGI